MSEPESLPNFKVALVFLIIVIGLAGAVLVIPSLEGHRTPYGEISDDEMVTGLLDGSLRFRAIPELERRIASSSELRAQLREILYHALGEDDFETEFRLERIYGALFPPTEETFEELQAKIRSTENPESRKRLCRVLLKEVQPAAPSPGFPEEFGKFAGWINRNGDKELRTRLAVYLASDPYWREVAPSSSHREAAVVLLRKVEIEYWNYIEAYHGMGIIDDPTYKDWMETYLQYGWSSHWNNCCGAIEWRENEEAKLRAALLELTDG